MSNKVELPNNLKKDLLIEIATLAATDQIYIATIQRKLNVGYVCATTHMQWLIDNDFACQSVDKKYSVEPAKLEKLKEEL